MDEAQSLVDGFHPIEMIYPFLLPYLHISDTYMVGKNQGEISMTTFRQKIVSVTVLTSLPGQYQ